MAVTDPEEFRALVVARFPSIRWREDVSMETMMLNYQRDVRKYRCAPVEHEIEAD